MLDLESLSTAPDVCGPEDTHSTTAMYYQLCTTKFCGAGGKDRYFVFLLGFFFGLGMFVVETARAVATTGAEKIRQLRRYGS